MKLLFSKKDTSGLVVPNHLAVIMDGNGRWAKTRLLPRVEGHRAGGKAVKKLVENCLKLGVKYLSVYAFSSENWNRPKEEVVSLMNLFEHYLKNEIDLFLKHNVRLRAIGDRTKLSSSLNQLINHAEELTRNNDAMQFIIAVSYGSRDELAKATQKIAFDVLASKVNVEQIDSSTIQDYLYAPDLPDVDLIIRTSNEFRVSNFLLWQSAYAEIVVTSCLWPDFNETELRNCFHQYGQRKRKFGLTQDQIDQNEKKLAVN